MDEAILKGTSHSTSIGFYSTDKGLEAAVSYVQGYVDKGNTWIGVTRFFDRKVTFGSGGSVSVIYCSDESKAFLKNRKTGKVDNTPTTDGSYVLYNTRLVKNAKGVWQTVDVISDRGAKQCQP